MSRPPIDETDLTAEEKKARVCWKALLAGFAIAKWAKPRIVYEHVSRMPGPNQMCFQLALKGAGHTTENFIPDEQVGGEASASLELLYEAAGKPTGVW